MCFTQHKPQHNKIKQITDNKTDNMTLSLIVTNKNVESLLGIINGSSPHYQMLHQHLFTSVCKMLRISLLSESENSALVRGDAMFNHIRKCSTLFFWVSNVQPKKRLKVILQIYIRQKMLEFFSYENQKWPSTRCILY